MSIFKIDFFLQVPDNSAKYCSQFESHEELIIVELLTNYRKT